jgi:hypothetical protein
MKNKFITRLLTLVTIIIIFHSCRNDVLPEQEINSNSSKFQMVSKTIPLNQSKHKALLGAELQKAQNNLQKNKINAFGKTIDYGNGITIDTDHVIYIENGTDYHTYTFRIIRDNADENTPIENLVLSPLTDGTYRELLVTYNLTSQEKKALISGRGVDTNGKVNVIEVTKGTFNGSGQLAKSSQSCGWVEQTVFVSCSEHQHGEWNIGEWASCTASSPPSAYTTVHYLCNSVSDGTSDGGGAGNVPGFPGNPGDGGGGGGGTDGGGFNPTEQCNGNGVLTGPQHPNTDLGVTGGDGSIGNDGVCSGIPTQPNTPPPPTPCERLGTLLDPAKLNLKELITSGMYAYINNSSTGEAAISFKREKTGIISSEVLPYTPGAKANIKTGGRYYCAVHTHPNSTYPMFSFSDIYALYKLEMNSGYYNTGHSSFLLVCQDESGVKQTYAITFESVGLMMEDVFANPENIGCTEEEIVKQLDDALKLKYENEAEKSNPNYESVFLQFNFGSNIGLHKANTNLTSWSKLSIDTNSDTATVVSTNCN